MAAPHAAGALALLLGAFPGLSADQQEAALANGAVDKGSTGLDYDYGYGRLDALAAYDWLASAPADFNLAAAPSSATATPGGTASYTVSVGGVNGFGGDVSLSLTGLSASRAGWTFNPAVVPGGSGTSQLTVTTAATIAPGSYPLTITGTSGATSHAASVTLVVSAPPDFSLSASPSSRSATLGAAPPSPSQ